MAVKFERVKAGDVLYDYRLDGTMRRWANWKVVVISIDHAAGTAMTSWNGNPPRLCGRRNFKTLRRTPGKT